MIKLTSSYFRPARARFFFRVYFCSRFLLISRKCRAKSWAWETSAVVTSALEQCVDLYASFGIDGPRGIAKKRYLPILRWLKELSVAPAYTDPLPKTIPKPSFSKLFSVWLVYLPTPRWRTSPFKMTSSVIYGGEQLQNTASLLNLLNGQIMNLLFSSKSVMICAQLTWSFDMTASLG